MNVFSQWSYALQSAKKTLWRECLHLLCEGVEMQISTHLSFARYPIGSVGAGLNAMSAHTGDNLPHKDSHRRSSLSIQ